MVKTGLKLRRVVRSRIELYERRLSEGWTQKMLAAELTEEGFVINLKYLSKCIVLARKKPTNNLSAHNSNNNAVIKPKTIQGKDAEFKLLQLNDNELF